MKCFIKRKKLVKIKLSQQIKIFEINHGIKNLGNFIMLNKLKNIFSKKSKNDFFDGELISDVNNADDFASDVPTNVQTTITRKKAPLAKVAKFHVRTNIKVAIFVLFAIFILSANLSSILKKIINVENVKTEIEAELLKITGKKAIITDAIDLEIVPKAVINIKNLKLKEQNILGGDDFLNISNVVVYPKLWKLFFGDIDFESVNVENVEIYVKKPKNTDSNYDNIINTITNSNLSSYFSKVKSFDIANLHLFVIKGVEAEEIRKDYLLKNVMLNFEEGANFSARLSEEFSLKANLDNSDLNINLENNGNNKINISGVIENKNKLSFNGKLSGDFIDLDKYLIKIVFPNLDISKISGTPENFKILSDVTFKDGTINLPNIKIESKNLALNIASNIVFSDKNIYSSEIKIPELEIEKLFPNSLELFLKEIEKVNSKRDENKIDIAGIEQEDIKKKVEPETKNEAPKAEVENKQLSPIFKIYNDTEVQLSIDIEKLKFSNLESNLNAKFNISGENFGIDFINVNLPGNSLVNFSSNLKVNKDNNYLLGASRLNLVIQDTKKLIDIIDPNRDYFATDIPSLVALKSELYNYQDKLHARKVELVFGENKAVGQIVVDFSEEKMNATAAFKFDKIFLQPSNNKDESELNKLIRKFDSARYISSIIDNFNLSLQADSLNYNGEEFNEFSAFINIKDDKIYFSDLQTNSVNYGEVTGKIDSELNVFQPKININLELSKLDYKNNPINKTFLFNGAWPEEKVSFEKYSLVGGQVKLAVDEFNYFGVKLNNLKLDSTLSGDKILLNKSRFDYNNSKFDFEGEFTTEYPSINLSFTTTNLDINKFISQMFDNDNIYGSFNISGNVAMSGANVQQMVKSLKGTVNFTSTGVKAKGFDIAKLSQKVSESNKIKEIRMWSDRFLTSGETTFGYLSGTMIVDKGLAVIKDLSLSNDILRSAKFYTKYDLVNWNVDSILDLNVITKGEGKYNIGTEFPVEINYSGNINNPAQSKDTKGIEKYWEDKFYR